ncbi:hypothetical protein [Sneathiella glossodoripedis]|uniref:portal protein n=1 Tax=Sneathiella glossodoripedis TaxID=418853 RepID=UPI000470E343|nr:hypothetical protein [Sneathiella glossodoripedis]
MENSLAQLIEWAEAAEESTTGARKQAERDRDYYDNIQWTAEEQAELKKRKQPIITINRIKRKIDFLTGIEKQQRTDPKAYPRTPKDEEGAIAASDALRFVEQKNNFDSIASDGWENLLVEGVCGCEVGIRMKGDDPEIIITGWAWDRLFYDPYSSKKDFSDARFLGGMIWMDADQAVTRWSHAKDAIELTVSEASTADTYDDKPKHTMWGIRSASA